MSPQTVFEVVANKLGRPLTLDERQCLRRLSPQGVAKLNHDLLNDVDLASTLADFQAVYAKMRERHAVVLESLSAEAQAMLDQMGRPATVDELNLLANVPVPAIRLIVQKRTKEGETLSSAINELANEFKYQRLNADATAFGETQSLPTRVNVLTPILRPSTPNALAPNMATVRKTQISVGLSPIVLWFKPDESDDTEADDEDDGLTVMSSPSLTSISKRWGSTDSLRLPRSRAGSSNGSVSESFPSSSSLGSIQSPPSKRVTVVVQPINGALLRGPSFTQQASIKRATPAWQRYVESLREGHQTDGSNDRSSLPKLTSSPVLLPSPVPTDVRKIPPSDSAVTERKTENVRRSFFPSLSKMFVA